MWCVTRSSSAGAGGKIVGSQNLGAVEKHGGTVVNGQGQPKPFEGCGIRHLEISPKPGGGIFLDTG